MLENKVSVEFYREFFEKKYRKLSDDEWIAMAEWIESQCETHIWEYVGYYISDLMENDVRDMLEAD